MKINVRMIGSVLAFLLMISFSAAQEIEVIGSVKDADSNYIAGANVYVDGVNTYTKTNARGYYKVMAKPDTQVISVYSEKYGLMSAVYSGQTRLNFMFLEKNDDKASNDDLAGLVDIGYGSVEKENLTQSVSSYNANKKNSDAASFTNIFDMIRSRVPGVTVTPNKRIVVRGVSSLNGIAQPLFVVNGQIVDAIDYIPPVEVESIEFLKDGSASIYGSRGANGVLLIKLKS